VQVKGPSFAPASVKVALAVAAWPSSEGSGATVGAATAGGTFSTSWLAEFTPLSPSSSLTTIVTV
jgi:hypothetical protein